MNIAHCLLDIAINLASTKHYKQTDKIGHPYILHPLRVMMAGKTIEEKIVGVLHDVVEDTDVMLIDLAEIGFPGYIINAIDALSKRDDESYKESIARVKENPLATKVKLLDIQDNSNILRSVTDLDTALRLRKKYHYAIHELKPDGGFEIP